MIFVELSPKRTTFYDLSTALSTILVDNFRAQLTLQNSAIALSVRPTFERIVMRYLLLLLVLILNCTETFAQNNNCSTNYLNQEKPVIHNALIKQMTKELCFNGFAVMHSGLTKTPLWSAQLLTKEKLFAPKLKRQDNFHEEASIPYNERATLKDYQGSGYDRGHLTPNGDLFDRASKDDSFSLANIVPQNPQNNQVLWEGIETTVRNIVKNRSDSYVITGVLFLNGRNMMNGRVAIPSHLYKIVYLIKSKQVSVYYVENKETMDYQVITLAQLEKVARINFLPSVNDTIKETKIDLPPPQISSRNQNKHSSSHSEARAQNHNFIQTIRYLFR